MMQSVDIAIVGGGMVGLALAAAFKDSDLRIAVIEGRTPDESLAELPDVRVSALSRSSETILRNLGVWEGITRRRLSPYSAMEVWEQDSFARIEFSANALGQPDSVGPAGAGSADEQCDVIHARHLSLSGRQ